jgi:hypothetical protein
VFRCTFYCDNPKCSGAGSEWTDTLLVAGVSWCPNCEQRAEPDSIEELTECGPEFEDDEPELIDLDPDRLRENRDERRALWEAV